MKFVSLLLLLLPPVLLANSADDDFNRAMELARRKLYGEARETFLRGWKQAPRDKRFAIELAGLEFQQHRYGKSKGYLKRAERIDPKDAYVQQFLGTIFYLQGNLDAALLHWNRIGLPHIEQIRFTSSLKTQRALLDSAFVFSAASTLQLQQLQESRSRLDLLHVFPAYKFHLNAVEDQKYDLLFSPIERDGWGNTPLDVAISLLRGLPYQTIFPEFYNWRGTGTNVLSLLRWDADKRRAQVSLSEPLQANPARRWNVTLDGRQENWNLPLIANDFRFENTKINFGIESVLDGRWSLSNQISFGHSEFRNFTLFPEGKSIQFTGMLTHRREFPENITVMTSYGALNFGRFFGKSRARFAQIEGGTEFRSAAFQISGRFGKSFGEIPFDNLYMLGVERDNDLWLRGHSGFTRKKGVLPIGRDFVLLNSEIDHPVYRNGLMQLRVGPFLDSGKTWDHANLLEDRRWLVDSGIQAKLKVLGIIQADFVYGRDLRSGKHAFYINVVR